MRWIGHEGLLIILGAACAAPRAAVVPRPSVNAAADQLTDLATAALEADGRFEPADSLYAPGAEIITEGKRHPVVPRFAGVERGGEVVVGSIRVDHRDSVAWATIEYRWLASDQNLIREGRATLVFVQAPGSGRWLIVHAHSSTPP